MAFDMESVDIGNPSRDEVCIIYRLDGQSPAPLRLDS